MKYLNGCPDSFESKIETDINNGDDVGYDYTWTGDGFSISVGAGLPLGKEADFYSLNFGLDVNYLFRISEDFGAGLGVGYTQFLGKDVDGFKTGGVGFIPVHAKAEYSLSEQIAAYGTLGYGIATDKGSGGIEVGVGAKYKIAKNIEVGPAFKSIIVEGGSFSTITLGVDIGL